MDFNGIPRGDLSETDGFLHRYFLDNSHKRMNKWYHYFDIYTRHLHRFRGRSPVLLEIGVMGGGSLQMWRDYLGPDSTVIGLDINPDCLQHQGEGIEVFIGSQDDPAVIEAIFNKHPRLDVVIDDGSHLMPHMRASFEMLYNRLHPTGTYIVEDTHTCYWPEYGGGLGKPQSFMEFTKAKLDELNAVHTRGAVPVSLFTRSTQGIAIYDSIVVFERRPQGLRQAHVTRPMPE